MNRNRPLGGNDMLIITGLLHPMIHLGYGLEFNQPAIVAEALANAAIHDDFMGTICFPAEQVSRRRKGSEDPLLI